MLHSGGAHISAFNSLGGPHQRFAGQPTQTFEATFIHGRNFAYRARKYQILDSRRAVPECSFSSALATLLPKLSAPEPTMGPAQSGQQHRVPSKIIGSRAGATRALLHPSASNVV